jgi:hypothetical protein
MKEKTMNGIQTKRRHRVSVLFTWTVAFLGRGRAERVITAQQVFGRHAIEAQAAATGVWNGP